jgi:hypothetical protein
MLHQESAGLLTAINQYFAEVWGFRLYEYDTGHVHFHRGVNIYLSFAPF